MLLITPPTAEGQVETHTDPAILSSRLDPRDARKGPLQVLADSRSLPPAVYLGTVSVSVRIPLCISDMVRGSGLHTFTRCCYVGGAR